MLLRRRPLARAAMLGGTAYVAGRAGARRGAANAQAEAAPPVDPAPAYAAPSGESNEDAMAELTQLKQLLDSGTLTQAEFDAQKQKILQKMS